MKYYCIHHNIAYDRKFYIQEKINLPQNEIIWIEDFSPFDNFIANHTPINCEHAASNNRLNNAELSCYYKHRSAIKQLSSSQDYGFIFEDDILQPTFNDKLIDTLEIFYNLMLINSADILFIGSFDMYDLSYSDTPYIINNNSTLSRCAHAYIISYFAASMINECLNNIIAPIDWQLNYCIQALNLRSFWSYPHIYQKTEKGLIKSLIR